MNNDTKRGLGLFLLGSTVAAAGIALYLYLDENARHRVEGMINREKAKAFVRHRLDGNETLVKAVDNMSDAEVNHLVKLSEKAVDMKDNVSDSIQDMLEKAKTMTKDVTDRVSDYL